MYACSARTTSLMILTFTEGGDRLVAATVVMAATRVRNINAWKLIVNQKQQKDLNDCRVPQHESCVPPVIGQCRSTIPCSCTLYIYCCGNNEAVLTAYSRLNTPIFHVMIPNPCRKYQRLSSQPSLAAPFFPPNFCQPTQWFFLFENKYSE